MSVETKDVETQSETNVKQAVPFFMISSMEESLRFYLEGSSFVSRRVPVASSRPRLPLAAKRK